MCVCIYRPGYACGRHKVTHTHTHISVSGVVPWRHLYKLVGVRVCVCVCVCVYVSQKWTPVCVCVCVCTCEYAQRCYFCRALKSASLGGVCVCVCMSGRMAREFLTLEQTYMYTHMLTHTQTRRAYTEYTGPQKCECVCVCIFSLTHTLTHL